MDTLYTLGDTITQYKTESVHFCGFMNSASKLRRLVLWGLSSEGQYVRPAHRMFPNE